MDAINPRAEVAVVANPEFLREGAAIEDFRHPQRILIGVEDERARATMDAVYRVFRLNAVPIVFTSRRAAELTKHAANAYLAMKATFINEIADLCDAVDADVAEVAHGLGLDRRIGPDFLRPGPGFGGSCLPKDVRALVGTARDNNAPLRLIETTIAINEARKRMMADRVIAACGGTVRGKTIGLLDLTFKANTDDMREASSLAIIAALQHAGAKVRAYDPVGMAAALVEDVAFGADPYDAATGAAALVIVTEWDAFRALDFGRLRQTMAEPVVVDLRNLLDPREVISHGFRYTGLGKPVGIAANMVSVAAE
jgi:UDPglucose 6-dehydrogenase